MAEAATFSIEAEGLTKRFGATPALNGVDLELTGGEVIALVGPNGAGKTTLLLILAGLLAPDTGRARIYGADTVARPKDVHGAIGWMPDFFGVYDDLTAREYLELFGAAYRMTRTDAAKRAAELIERLHLEYLADARVHTLSRGQKQKLGLARAIVHKPRVLLLDEPASGLDPQGRAELRALVRQEAETGTTVLISSHILGDLEELSDSVVFMSAGRVQRVATMDELPVLHEARQWRIRSLDPPRLMSALSDLSIEARPDHLGVVVMLLNEGQAADLNARLVSAGVPVVEFAPVTRAIEEAFMSLERDSRT